MSTPKSKTTKSKTPKGKTPKGKTPKSKTPKGKTPKSVTRRLSANLASNIRKNNRTTPIKRNNVLRARNYNQKYPSLRTQYQHSNKYRYPKLKSILRSHKNNLQKYIYNEDKRRRNERAEALKEAYQAPSYLSVPGLRIPVEASEAQLAKRLKAVNYHYPERQRSTYEQSKRGGPKGTKKEIQRIRTGLRATRNKKQKQKILPFIGLPNNINNNYYRANNVPQMVKNSHLASNRQIYGNNMQMHGYYKFKPEVLTPTLPPRTPTPQPRTPTLPPRTPTPPPRTPTPPPRTPTPPGRRFEVTAFTPNYN